MQHNAADMPRITSTISFDLLNKVSELAAKEKRSLSLMIDLLLQQAIKERLRKRSATKESNT